MTPDISLSRYEYLLSAINQGSPALSDANNDNTGNIAIYVLTPSELSSWLESQQNHVHRQIELAGFNANSGSCCKIIDRNGNLQYIIYGKNDEYEQLWQLANNNISKLPAGNYQLTQIDTLNPQQIISYAFSWAISHYKFDDYQGNNNVQENINQESIDLQSRILYLNNKLDNKQFQELKSKIISHAITRDLVNIPACDLTPEQIANISNHILAQQYQATYQHIKGEDLIAAKCHAIYAVGKAADAEPYLIRVNWQSNISEHKSQASGKIPKIALPKIALPKIALIGKGITFDSGGLNIKPSNAMRYMKKDMGGAAHILALAHMIIANNLPIRLDMLLASAENAISGNAFRPGDVINSHKGITIEIDNTDAEGRLVMADALSIATEDTDDLPDLIIDCATLTGAARVAVGTEIAAFFCNDSELEIQLKNISLESGDAMWPLPIWPGYKKSLASKIADCQNSDNSPFAGAITAALFLEQFITPSQPANTDQNNDVEITKPTPKWIHVDLMAWNNRARPGRPIGGEAMGIHALYELVKHFANSYNQ